MGGELLRVRGLEVVFPSAGVDVRVVRGLSFAMKAGEALGLVGESGCGKSVAALSLLGLTPRPGRVAGGSISLGGRELTGLADRELRALRGREIGMVFQEPMTSLDPVFTVGCQLAEAFRARGRLSAEEVRSRSVAVLREVGVPEPGQRLAAYPWELSGGLRQRVMIAIAIACSPRLLIADEPTTALDVTIQAQIMGLLETLRSGHGTGLLLITHDLGLVAQHVDRVVVMYAGHAVEEAPVTELFGGALHPYTQGLLSSMPGGSALSREGRSRLRAIPGNVPQPAAVPSGCPFRDRCDRCVARCAEALPPLEEKGRGHRVRCFRAEGRV